MVEWDGVSLTVKEEGLFTAILYLVRGHSYIARSILSNSQSCCGLGGCKAIFLCFVFKQAIKVFLRLWMQCILLKGTPHIVLQTKSLFPHARPIRSYVSKMIFRDLSNLSHSKIGSLDCCARPVVSLVRKVLFFCLLARCNTIGYVISW